MGVYKTGVVLEMNWKCCTFLAEYMQASLQECCWEMGRIERTCKEPFISLTLKASIIKGYVLSLVDQVPGGGILSQVTFL